ncbi:hypothetical protein LZ31DRAFT_574774 [Colletotrichum somersetense]|nr:hypothetical protein LZ31DRAFT_574774 [Colletotrichum somersetense]
MPPKPQDHDSDGPEGDAPNDSQGDRKASLYSRPWHIAKIAIRGCDIASSIIVIAITLHMLVTIGYSSPYLLLFSGIPGVVAIIWDVSELVTICARGGRKGIHPGAHVGLHLIFCLAFTTAIVCEALFCHSFYWPFAAQEHVALAFTCLLLLDHFILFVRACIETSQRDAGAPICAVPSGTTAPQQQQDAHDEKGQMTDANVPAETTPPSGSDGTCYGPGSQA